MAGLAAVEETIASRQQSQSQGTTLSTHELQVENRRLKVEINDLTSRGLRKDEEIARLTEQIEHLQRENDRLKLFGTPGISAGIVAYEGSLQPYDGKTEWDEFLTHVEVVALT